MVYIAASHSNRIQDPTFVMLARGLKEYPPRILLLEGFESSKGVSPRDIQEWARNDGRSGLFAGGEAAYAVQLAIKKKIPFRGLEPDETEICKALVALGFSTVEMIHFYFLRQVPQWQRAGTLNFEQIDVTYRDFAAGIAKKIGSPIVPGYGDFTQWYKNKNKEPFNEHNIDSEKSAPLARGRYYTQRMASAIGVVRDRHMIRIIEEELDARSPIFVVLGGSHWFTQKVALEALSGFPSYEYKQF